MTNVDNINLMVGKEVEFGISKEQTEIGTVIDKVSGLYIDKTESRTSNGSIKEKVVVDYYVIQVQSGKIYSNVLPWRILRVIN